MRILFMSQKDAEAIVPTDNMAIISIIDNDGDRNLNPGWNYLLPLAFDDIDREVYDYKLFSKEQGRQVLDFISMLPTSVDCIVVHCWAGISRSGAIAKYLSEYYQTTDFPSRYSLYNKHVYSTLRTVYNENLFHEEV